MYQIREGQSTQSFSTFHIYCIYILVVIISDPCVFSDQIISFSFVYLHLLFTLLRRGSPTVQVRSRMLLLRSTILSVERRASAEESAYYSYNPIWTGRGDAPLRVFANISKTVKPVFTKLF